MTVATLLRCAWMAAAVFLAGCTLPARTPSLATATKEPLAPRPLPTSTLTILTSDELYSEEVLAIGRTDPSFASLPVDAALPPVPIGDTQRRVKILLEDGSLIEGERFGFGLLRQPGILLLGPEANVWRSLPRQLEAAGFIVFALETEGRLRAGQLNTVLRSMLAINTVDAGKIGIVGAEGSADLALLGCAINDLCDAAALLSPLSRDTLLNMMPSYDTRPLWLAAAKDDIEAYAAALALSQTALGEMRFHELDSGRGIDLLNEQENLAEDLVEWFAVQLREK